MTQAKTAHAEPSDWLPSNPWSWIVLSLAAAAGAWLWLALLGAEIWPALRFGFVVVALLACGVALTMRLRFNGEIYLGKLAPSQRLLVLLLMAGLFGLMAIGVTALLATSFFSPRRVPASWGQLLLWWVVVAPMAGGAALQCLRRMGANETLQEREEGATLLLLTALVVFACRWALYDPQDPLALDTMRVFLGGVILAALVAAPLVLLPQETRRRVIVMLILLHFGGILTAGFSSPPSALPVRQLWMRIYRPYLEYMYLVNAYHFYAPEPGPTSYLWFRVQYENPEVGLLGEWVKVPDVDDKSFHRYPTGLTYQRYVAITENTLPTDPPASFFVINPDGGGLRPAPYYRRRVEHSPDGVKKPLVIGEAPPRVGLVVPWHPELSHVQQYLPPAVSAKELLKSYVRHVAHEAERDGKRVKSIKLYRLIHVIPMAELYLTGVQDPDDPDTYRPIFLGEYDADSNLLDEDEPFLYWMLPTIKKDPTSRTSRYESFVRKHAGDPDWIRDEKKQWVPE